MRAHQHWRQGFATRPAYKQVTHLIAPHLAAEAQALPLPRATAELLWSNLMLHWQPDPLAGLREMHRVLKVGGLLMFSTFGPDTLKELRACFADGDEHTLRFIDMHDYGDMLIECGFADPVMDAERLTITYPSLDALLDASGGQRIRQRVTGPQNTPLLDRKSVV